MFVSVSTRLTYLRILFILEMARAACKTGHLENKWNAQISQPHRKWANKLKSIEFHLTLYTEHDSTLFVVVSEILTSWNNYLTNHGNMLTNYIWPNYWVSDMSPRQCISFHAPSSMLNPGTFPRFSSETQTGHLFWFKGTKHENTWCWPS